MPTASRSRSGAGTHGLLAQWYVEFRDLMNSQLLFGNPTLLTTVFCFRPRRAYKVPKTMRALFLPSLYSVDIRYIKLPTSHSLLVICLIKLNIYVPHPAPCRCSGEQALALRKPVGVGIVTICPQQGADRLYDAWYLLLRVHEGEAGRAPHPH